MNTRENVLQRLSAGLRREALAYRIVGIVGLVTAILMLIIGIVFMGAGTYMTATESSSSEIAFENNYIISDGDSSVEFNEDGFIIQDNDDYVEFNEDGFIIQDNDDSIEFNEDGIIIQDGNESIEITEEDAFIFAGVGVMAFGGFYIGFGCSLLAIAIVNLVMASKVSKSRYSEVLTAKHAGSVGSIVVAALFNEIALIFVIINFVQAKKNRAVLEG